MKRKPTPSFVISCIALFVALGGTSYAAVSFATNAGKVDGKSAYASGSSLNRVAGNLVATEKDGAKKGQILGRYLTGVTQSRTFTVSVPVTDNATTAPISIGGDSRTGNLSVSCGDDAPAAGVERPLITLNYTAGGTAISYAQTIGANRTEATVLQPGQVDAQGVTGAQPFTVQAHTKGFAIDYVGSIRPDGTGTADAYCTVVGTLSRVQG
jgi:hypothetical protein